VKRILFGVILIFLWGSVALANPVKHSLDIRLEECLAKHPGTTSERHCIEQMMPLWDKALNLYYQRLGGDKNKALRRAQRAWLKFRKEEQRYIHVRFSLDGTMYRLMEANAYLELLRKRALELKFHYEFSKLLSE